MKFLSSLLSSVQSSKVYSAHHKNNELGFSFEKEKKIILIASILINLLALAFPLLMLQLYDRILPHQSLDTMSIFAVAICVAVGLESVVRVMRSYITAWVSARFEHNAMLGLVERSLVAPLSEFEFQGLGAVMENFKSISTLKNHYSGQTFQQLMDLPFTILYLVIIFALNLWIGLLLAVGCAIFIYLVGKVCASDAIRMKKQKLADQRRNNFLNETLTNVHTVKSMSMETLKLRRYENLQEDCAKNMAQNSYASEMSSGIGNVFSPLMTTLVVSLGAWLVITHQLTNGELAACVLLSMRSLAPIQRLGGMWSKYLQDQVLRKKLAKFLRKPGMKTGNEFQGMTENKISSLNLMDVTFKYAGANRPILEHINLNIQAGECIVISGSGGSGRSTLLQIMAGVLKPINGAVLLDREDISKIDLKELSQKIAYLPHDGQIFEGSLLDNVSLFDQQRIEKAVALAKKLGLSEFVSKMPRGWDSPAGDMATESLPPGYRQRIAIVRALSNDSSILLIDDPTATMDAEGDAQFLQYLESIKGKVTIVIVSQRPAYVKLANRRYFINEGKLAAIHSNQSMTAKAYFDSTNHRSSIDSQRWDSVQKTINTLFKTRTDLAGCLPVLLKQINAHASAREIAEALPDRSERLDLAGFQNAMAQLGYKVIKIRCRLGEIDSNSLPCLFLPDEGLGFVALGLYDRQMRKSADQSAEVELENDLTIQGEAYFYELAQTNSVENRSWVFRTILRFMPLIGQAMLSALVTGLVVMAGPLFMMVVYSTIIPSGALDTLFYLAIGSIISLASAYFFMRQRAHILSYIAGRIDYLFGTAIFEKILRMSPALTERGSVGSQLSRLQSFDAIRDLFNGPLASTLLEMPATLILLAVLSIINPVALIIFIVMATIYILMYWCFAVPTRDRVTELSRTTSKRNQFLVEMICKMRAVRECGAQALWYARFKDISASATVAGFRAEKLSMMLIGISYFVMMISALLIVIVTVPLVFTQTVASGALIASMMLMWRVLTPIQTFFTNMSRIERVRTSVRQVDSLMKISGEPARVASSMINRDLKGQIEFSRVSFRYSMNADPALIGLEMKIYPGEMVALSGPNGGGKSTVLKMILQMYQPQAGSILIDNIDARQIAPVELRRMIGYVPQDVQLFKTTIAQNLRLAHPDATDEQLYDALDIAGALNQVLALPGGINYRSGDQSRQLSASLRQKISLARCYLTKAPIMLLDEPGAGLDEAGDRCLIEAMQALKGKSTVIFISHKPSHILLADTLMVFDKGYLREAGSPSELLQKSVAA